MKFINEYKEFGAESQISVVDHISSEPLPFKDKILKYLKDAPQDGIRCSTLNDYIAKKLLSPSVWMRTDGEYYWDDEETYHFEKYNIALNPDFIKKVLSK